MTKAEIAKLKKFANRKNTLAVLDYCMVKDGKITVSDLEFSGQFKTDIKGEGLIYLGDIERPYDEAWIENLTLHVKRGTSVSTSSAHPIDDYPRINFDNETRETDGNEYYFNDHQSLTVLKPFLGNDELRPAMSGFGFRNGRIYSTDAHKLAWEVYSDKTEMPEIILPGKSAVILSDIKYKAYFDKTNILFHSTDGAEKILIKVIEGNFPNVESVIPDFNPLTIKVNTKTLLTEIENAMQCANKTTKQIEFLFENKQLTIQANDLDFSKQYKNTIDTESESHVPFKIGFNGIFLKQVIEKKYTTTTFVFRNSRRATIINGNRLLMPVMLSSDSVYYSAGDYIENVIKKYFDQAIENESLALSEFKKFADQLPDTHIKHYQTPVETLISDLNKSLKEMAADNEKRPQIMNSIAFYKKMKSLFRKITSIPSDTEMVENQPSHETPVEVIPENVTPEASPEENSPEETDLVEDAEIVEEFPTFGETPTVKSEEPKAKSQQPTAEIEPPTNQQINESTDQPSNEDPDSPAIFIVRDFTPKSFIVFGDIDAIAEQLEAAHGKFTRNLRVNNFTKADGYWFSSKRLEQVEKIIANS